MPFGDGTGPIGKNAASRRRAGGGMEGVGSGGYCVCPQCGAKVKHQRSNPCYSITCPKCGARMTRA